MKKKNFDKKILLKIFLVLYISNLLEFYLFRTIMSAVSCNSHDSHDNHEIFI